MKLNKTHIKLAAAVGVIALGAFFSVKTAPALGIPTLLTPYQNSSTNSYPQFTWTKTDRATSYQIQVALAADTVFSLPLINQIVPGTSFTPTSPLAENSYRWQVRALRRDQAGNWSSVFIFTVVSSTFSFSDDFSSYIAGTCLADGTIFGPWTTVFNGFGCIQVEGLDTLRWLHESPQSSTSPGETHATLVVGPSFSGALTYEVKSLTAEQLRTSSPSNPWEVAWTIWNYTDNNHFYYFIAKPNGWELGKRDPAYAGGQRFLASGPSPFFPIGNWYTIQVSQSLDNTIMVRVNGNLITTFVDTEQPYTSGKIGLYSEDAHVHWDDVKVW